MAAMGTAWFSRIGLFLCLLVPAVQEVSAQQLHRATQLGNPATRFTPPLRTPGDLRHLFTDSQLRADVVSILRDWNWKGDAQDLFRAASTQQIATVQLPVGTHMPFMSSRKNGHPVLLRDVVWAGREPAAAYAFNFSSKGRRYRCVTPVACGNFYLEDLGAPLLTLECRAPEQALSGKPVEVCFALQNKGDATEAKTLITVSVPPGASYITPDKEKQGTARQLKWEIANLRPGETKLLCATFIRRQPGLMSFSSTAQSDGGQTVESSCATRIAGIPAILLEVVDVSDPIEIGNEVTYVIKVTSQGTATCSNVRLACLLPASQQYVSGSGDTSVRGQGSSARMDPIPLLAPKAQASWRVVVKALSADDARFKVELTSDEFQRPIVEAEATRQY